MRAGTRLPFRRTHRRGLGTPAARGPDQMTFEFRRLTIATRLRLSIAVGAVGLALLALQAYRVVASRMFEEREAKVRAVVDTVDGVLVAYEKLARDGRMTADEARRTALETVKTVRQSGAGYVDYLWPKPGASEPVRKISYVRLFEPWGWVVGSGLYLDDLDEAARGEGLRVLLVAALIVLVIGGGILALARGISRALGAAVKAASDVAAGRLAVSLEGERTGETGRLLDAMATMAGKLEDVVAEVRESSGSIAIASSSRP